MLKKAFFITIILSIALFSLAGLARAVDLPIDMGALKNQQYSGDAVTPRFNIDLFSEKSAALTLVMTADAREQQARTVGSLFAREHSLAAGDPTAQLTTAASGWALFTAPNEHSGTAAAKSGGSIPVWVIVLVLAVCAGTGLLLANRLQKRKGNDHGVHSSDH